VKVEDAILMLEQGQVLQDVDDYQWRRTFSGKYEIRLAGQVEWRECNRKPTEADEPFEEVVNQNITES